MLDPAVTITNVRSGVSFDPVTFTPGGVIITTYMVGNHGPFILTTPKDKYTEEYVQTETAKMVATLRATGALPAM